MNRFQRTELMIGCEKQARLGNASVLVFGIGGVGGYVVEALARAGVGRITLVDHDVIDVTNINRQIIALTSTIGRKKVDVALERVLEINPSCDVKALCEFLTPDNIAGFRLTEYDYVIDAVDNVTAKLSLAVYCEQNGVQLISSMGTGNKLHPELFKIADIYETKVCPLARVMRAELKKRGVQTLRVVYSEEMPLRSERPPASISFVPSTAGLLIASDVINALLK